MQDMPEKLFHRMLCDSPNKGQAANLPSLLQRVQESHESVLGKFPRHKTGR